MLPFFPRGVLDEILNLIESVSEGFLSYLSYLIAMIARATIMAEFVCMLRIVFSLSVDLILKCRISNVYES